MTSRKKSAPAIAALAAMEEDDEEEEEDEALPFPTQPTTTTPSPTPTSLEPDIKRLKTETPLPTDVPTLHSLLQTAESRLEGFQTREQEYLRILTEKQKETTDLRATVTHLENYNHPAETWGRKVLLDPAVGVQFRLLHDELTAVKANERKLTEAVQAEHFSPESMTGKKLLAKCEKLQKENEELARRLAGGGGEKKGGKEADENVELKEEVKVLKKKLAHSQVRLEELEEERGLHTTLIYTWKKRLARYQEEAAMGAGFGEGEGEGGGGEEEGVGE